MIIVICHFIVPWLVTGIPTIYTFFQIYCSLVKLILGSLCYPNVNTRAPYTLRSACQNYLKSKQRPRYLTCHWEDLWSYIYYGTIGCFADFCWLCYAATTPYFIQGFSPLTWKLLLSSASRSFLKCSFRRLRIKFLQRFALPFYGDIVILAR